MGVVRQFFVEVLEKVLALILKKTSEIMVPSPTVPLAGESCKQKNRAHTCLEPPQVSGRHSEFVAPLSIAHVRGKTVIQSISWVMQESETGQEIGARGNGNLGVSGGI